MSNVFKLNQNIRWGIVLGLCLLNVLFQLEINILIFSWSLIVIVNGNIRQLPIRNDRYIYEFIRKNLYVAPLGLMVFICWNLINFEIYNTNFIFIIIGILTPITLYLFEYSNLTLLMSSDVIKMSKPKPTIFYIYNAWLGIAGAIFEELFYRGLVISICIEALGYYSILVSMVLFIGHHFSTQWGTNDFRLKDCINQAVISIVNSYIYIKTGNIYLCILSHLLFNSVLIFFNLKTLIIFKYNVNKNERSENNEKV